MFAFWTAVVAVGMSGHLLSAIFRKSPQGGQPKSSNDSFDDSLTSTADKGGISRRVYMWLSRHFMIPAAFGSKASQSYGWYTVPPRMQSLTILAFIIVNAIFCIHGYRVFPGNI